MAFLRAGICGNLQLLGRYFYPIAQTDLEGNTQAAEKKPSGKHKSGKGDEDTAIHLTGRFSRKCGCCNGWVKC